MFVNHSITGSPQLGQVKAPGGILVPHFLQVHTSFVFDAAHAFLVGIAFTGSTFLFVALPVAYAAIQQPSVHAIVPIINSVNEAESCNASILSTTKNPAPSSVPKNPAVAPQKPCFALTPAITPEIHHATQTAMNDTSDVAERNIPLNMLSTIGFNSKAVKEAALLGSKNNWEISKADKPTEITSIVLIIGLVV